MAVTWNRSVRGRPRYEGLGFHDLRRAAATGLVAEGVDVKTAQRLLGHSDSRLTLDHYAQVVTEQGEAAARRWAGGSSARHRAMSARWRGRERATGGTEVPPELESGGGDLNSRPLRPERSALPS